MRIAVTVDNYYGRKHLKASIAPSEDEVPQK